MTSLLDVVVVKKKVKTHKFGDVDVDGLSIEGIAQLITAHPELIQLFKGESENIDLNKIIALGAEITASFLAAGLGFPGNKEAIVRCKSMNAEDALTIGTAILEESFPGGAANFFHRVKEAASAAQALVPIKDPE